MPRDVVRDGLPHFGSLRDDWQGQGKARKHLGYDIYVDNSNVLAMADGVVTRVSGGNLARITSYNVCYTKLLRAGLTRLAYVLTLQQPITCRVLWDQCN